MILSAGLTPAWQQIVVLDRLRVGEVNRARDLHWCASGKVLNVGTAIAHLNAVGSVLSLVGGPPQAAIEAEFIAHGINCRWVESRNPTRVCTTVIDAESGIMTELVENAPAATAEELSEFSVAFAEAVSGTRAVVLSGSLPANTPADYYFQLMRNVEQPVILDARGPELIAAVAAHPFLVKPNREELEKTLGRPVNIGNLKFAMQELNQLGARHVLVSAGPGEVWFTARDEAWAFTPPKVNVINAIGCGDCLAAGIAVGLGHGAEPIEAVRFGMAAAGNNAEMLLPARLNLARVKELETQVAVRRIE